MGLQWFRVVPIPEAAEASRPVAHAVRGKPGAAYPFHDDNGLVGYLYRYTGSDGDVRDHTLTYWVNERGEHKWSWRVFADPRPLYGPHKLSFATNPEAPVIITDDPACMNAVEDWLEGFACVAWFGGTAKAAMKFDWKPLAGRHTILWPTVDEGERPFLQAAKDVAIVLNKLGCDVRLVELSAPRVDMIGYNIARAKLKGIHPADLLVWMSEHIKPVFTKLSATKDVSVAHGSRAIASADSTLIRSDKGAPKACEYNARSIFAESPHLAGLFFDEFLCRLRIGARDWTDHDDLEALCWLQATFKVHNFTLGQVRNAIAALAYTRRRDSLREFIAALPAWDSVPRIELAFVDAWGAEDTPLTRAAARNFFIALIARALRPGAQVDTLWVIEGPQGISKSRSMRALGGSFHAEISAQVGTADFQRELRSLWIAEMSELDSLRGREASTIKRLLSAPFDRFVEKYEKHATSYPRRAVAVATTNEANYWLDSTGARRLVPIKARDIRIDLIEANRLQWFAEALSLFEQGASWWEFPTEIAMQQEDRQQVDPWEDILSGLIANGRSTDGYTSIPWPDGWIESAEIMSKWLRLNADQQGAASGNRLGKVMRKLGFEPTRFGKAGLRGWIKGPKADTHVANI